MRAETAPATKAVVEIWVELVPPAAVEALAVSFHQVVHPVPREEAGVAKQQHPLGGPDEDP